jgi:signal transduction histidine kinase
MPFELWVVDEAGQVLAASSERTPPPHLMAQPRPQQVHELLARGRFFSGSAAAAIVKLDAEPAAWLVVGNPGSAAHGTFRTIALLFVAILLGAMLLGLTMVMLYLRGRAGEAKAVLADMQAGNLAVRFHVDRLDEVGGLMQNFNRMADEIQKLVAQLQATERTRRELLQELGHDLRTPLTSLRTAIETLSAHGEAMPQQERREFFVLVGSELSYFTKLIDDLFFIAEIDQPRYRQHASKLALPELVAAEMRSAQGMQPALAFTLEQPGAACTIHGDAYLVARLLRNLYDNTARHAQHKVITRLQRVGQEVQLTIEDDGPGMSAEAIQSYGQRRSRRNGERNIGPEGRIGLSLGLGSVIVKTIAELHGGRLQISSSATDAGVQGTRVSVIFPAVD